MRGTRHERDWNKRIIRDRSPRTIVQRSYRGAACHLQRRSHCVFSAAEEFVRPSGVDCDPVFSGCFAMSAARETLLSALDASVHPLIGRGLVAAGTIASAEIGGDAAPVVIALGFPTPSTRAYPAQELGEP